MSVGTAAARRPKPRLDRLDRLAPRVRHAPWVDLTIAVVVVLALAAPALFTSNGFIDDWVDHLWLTWIQSREIHATGLPSLFVNATGLGVFYPNFLFYGGTLYAIGGYLIVLTGAPVAVFVGLLTAALCAAYGGTLWIARQAGLRATAAHLPAVVVVTGAYYLSLAYGRGSWPELIATSAIPLIAASALSIVRCGARLGPVIGLAIATIFWSGSHNISLEWGALYLAGIAVALLLAWAPRLTRVHVGRLVLVLSVVVLGVMVNGWFLLPDIRYALHTGVAQVSGIDPFISDRFSRLGIVFDPLRVRASANPYLRSHFTELPVLVLAWALIAAGVSSRRARGRAELRRLVCALLLLIAALLVLLTDDAAWKLLPSALNHVQFTFRLQTYIVMAIAGLVIAALNATANPHRALRDRLLVGSLVVFVVFGLGEACWQVWSSDAGYYPYSRTLLRNRSFVLRYPHRTPPTWYVYEFLASFRDASARVVSTQGTIDLDPAKVAGGHTTQLVTVPAGRGPVATNIASPAYIVKVSGLRVAGRTADGYLALARRSPARMRLRLSVSRAGTTAMRLAPFVTLAGVAGLLAVLIAVALLPKRRRFQGVPSGAPSRRRGVDNSAVGPNVLHWRPR